MKIIINGANGYIASNFIASLLQKGHQVIALVRASKDCDPQERMQRALKECTTDNTIINSTQLEVMAYHLNAVNFGLDKDQIQHLFEGCSHYFHFAATLKFSKKAKAEIFKTNVDGLTNSIEIFQHYSEFNARFYFISTAYSCGLETEKVREQVYPIEPIQAFRNFYEQSKRYAENMILDYVKNQKLNGYILRPSQVVGHSQTGETKTDFGVFDFVKRMSYLSKRYPNETIRIKADASTTQNLIPIDVLTNLLVNVISTSELQMVTHLVATEATQNKEVINYLNEELEINIEMNPELQKHEMNALERILDAGMAFTGSYSQCHINFETSNQKQLTRASAIKVEQESLHKMIGYFLNHN